MPSGSLALAVVDCARVYRLGNLNGVPDRVHSSKSFTRAPAGVVTGLSLVALAVVEVVRWSEATLKTETDRSARNSAGRESRLTSSQAFAEGVAAPVAPQHVVSRLTRTHSQDFLLTLGPFTDTVTPNRMVLPLRAVPQTNCRPLAVGLPRTLAHSCSRGNPLFWIWPDGAGWILIKPAS